MTPHWRATESLSSTTMINTYKTSAFPPQPPPRHTSLPAEHLAPRRGPTRAVVRVLGLVVVLHLLLSCGGFYYLYTGRMVTSTLESSIDVSTEDDHNSPLFEEQQLPMEAFCVNYIYSLLCFLKIHVCCFRKQLGHFTILGIKLLVQMLFFFK